MKLKTIEISNFRLLKNVKINIAGDTTAIVGKNNSGKTALSNVFRIFYDDRKLSFEDISLSCHRRLFRLYNLYKRVNQGNRDAILNALQAYFPSVRLKLTLEYSDTDNWSRVKPFITKLDSGRELHILAECAPESIEKFFFLTSEALKGIPSPTNHQIITAFESLISSFKIKILTDAGDSIKKEQVLDLLRFHFIDAQRGVDDSNAIHGSKLSKVFQNHFKLKHGDNTSIVEDLKNAIGSANIDIDKQLKEFFKNFSESFGVFGFPGIQDQSLELKSNLDVESMLKSNVKLFYAHEDKYLSEKYNGLGYSNLIYIISEILSYHILNEKEARDLTVVFIEEPEAHMHPQMQDVFISQINKFINAKGFGVQLIVSTHSSHIISKSDFSSIRYFYKTGVETKVKDLLDFNRANVGSDNINFLKQYMTLGKCDLFFADKAIFFEGTVERVLLPIFLKKVSAVLGAKCLTRQYIAAVEIGGAYMDKFKELLEFLELKTLLITDLDAVLKPDNVKCEVKIGEGVVSSNSTLKNWIPMKESISDLLNAGEEDKTLNNIRVIYQKPDAAKGSKTGRSFEEAFVIQNSKYVYENKASILSLKRFLSEFGSEEEVLLKSYEIQVHIDNNKKKTNFVFDLISVNPGEWDVPAYIKDGLVWLAQ